MKLSTNKYIFCLLLFFVIGCQIDNKNLSSIITSSDCYWDVHDAYSTANEKIGYCYKFNKDGSCSFFFYDRKGVRNKYDFDDVVVPKTWKIQGDTVLYLQGIERIVVNFSKDTLLLENPVTKGRDTLVRNCKKIIL